MARRVARRPDDLKFAIAHRNHIAVRQILIRLRQRGVHSSTHPGRPHSLDGVLVDWKPMSHKELACLGASGWWPKRQHAVDPLDFELVKQGCCVAPLLDWSRGDKMVNVMV